MDQDYISSPEYMIEVSETKQIVCESCGAERETQRHVGMLSKADILASLENRVRKSRK